MVCWTEVLFGTLGGGSFGTLGGGSFGTLGGGSFGTLDGGSFGTLGGGSFGTLDGEIFSFGCSASKKQEFLSFLHQSSGCGRTGA